MKNGIYILMPLSMLQGITLATSNAALTTLRNNDQLVINIENKVTSDPKIVIQETDPNDCTKLWGDNLKKCLLSMDAPQLAQSLVRIPSAALNEVEINTTSYELDRLRYRIEVDPKAAAQVHAKYPGLVTKWVSLVARRKIAETPAKVEPVRKVRRTRLIMGLSGPFGLIPGLPRLIMNI